MVTLNRATAASSPGGEALRDTLNPGPARKDQAPVSLTGPELIEVLDDYKEKGQTAVAILQELNTLIGATFFPKLLSAAASFALYRDPTATQYQSPPLPFVFKLLPASVTQKVELVADFINFGTEVGVLPRAKLEQLATDKNSAELFVNLIKESIK